MESVYSAVRTDSLYKAYYAYSIKFNFSAPYTILSGAIAPLSPPPPPPSPSYIIHNYTDVPRYLTHETIIVGRSAQMYYNIE